MIKYGGINVSKLVTNCVLSNDKTIKNLLWKNIVLSGGTTMMNICVQIQKHNLLLEDQ